jgi:hypothetical protein
LRSVRRIARTVRGRRQGSPGHFHLEGERGETFWCFWRLVVGYEKGWRKSEKTSYFNRWRPTGADSPEGRRGLSAVIGRDSTRTELILFCSTNNQRRTVRRPYADCPPLYSSFTPATVIFLCSCIFQHRTVRVQCADCPPL